MLGTPICIDGRIILKWILQRDIRELYETDSNSGRQMFINSVMNLQVT